MRPRDQPSEEHMLGHGFYNKNSHAQGTANTFGLPLLLKAVDRVELDRVGRTFRIADYGSAQGHNSLLPVKTTISRVKSRWNNFSTKHPMPIEVFHTDLPGNDWSTLFNTVFNSSDSYLLGQSNVFVYASATSIYDQIFPDNYIIVGYSAIAVHWLSRKPCRIPGHIWSVRAEGEAQKQWRQQGQRDWHAFLQARANEIISSGALVIVGSGADANHNSGAEPLMDLANRILREMEEERLLTPDQVRDLSIPTYYRTRSEWEEPLNDLNFSRASKLRLLDYSEAALSDVYLDRYTETLDANSFARAYAGFFRAAYEPCLFSTLRQKRPKGCDLVIEEFFGRLKNELAKDPAKYSCRWLLSLILIGKE